MLVYKWTCWCLSGRVGARVGVFWCIHGRRERVPGVFFFLGSRKGKERKRRSFFPVDFERRPGAACFFSRLLPGEVGSLASLGYPYCCVSTDLPTFNPETSLVREKHRKMPRFALRSHHARLLFGFGSAYVYIYIADVGAFVGPGR